MPHIVLTPRPGVTISTHVTDVDALSPEALAAMEAVTKAALADLDKRCGCSCHGRGHGEPPCGYCWDHCA